MAELKLCPFCSGTARIKEHSFYNDKESTFADHTYGIRCSDCFTESYQYYQSKERAIEAWNKRAESEELRFTRQFIHEHGLEFALAAAWNRRAEDGK